MMAAAPEFQLTDATGAPQDSGTAARRSARDMVTASRPVPRRVWPWVAVGAVLSVLMRLRMLWTPISVDEGGYLAIARGWAHGKVLYRDVWVDRPQGLLVLFRGWDWVSGGNTASIRIMAMLFGVLLVVATAVAVRELVNPAAARCRRSSAVSCRRRQFWKRTRPMANC